MNYYLAVLKNYVGFSGRARRAEYWQFTLVNFIVLIALFVIDLAIKTPIPYLIYVLAIILPGLAVGVRRLHDTGRSGWWLLIGFVPFVGGIVLLVFACLDSEGGDNKYGANPKVPAYGAHA
ncbi:MAG TPA: DUF805 domain-containing protein [Actinocrinis sp.]|uniref:DUF805 domain-containing protein n=1 Tax=Actinocrinis sp. TaxID=1920516 RepID=UPI002DDD2185|nr:DUF805 domain-containing protein [Actinocrinis sp.]HEV2345544.1 DUF805 domain-containing protein [Actinocrinis sp.]